MYKVIAIAGTFDRLHKGHRYFISQTFKLGRKVLIGLTSDEFVKRKLETRNSKLETKSDKDTSGVARRDSPDGGGIRTQINNFQTRKKELEEFLKQEGLLERAQIVKIDDVYGPAIKNNGIEALIVTDETYEGGLLVNKKRVELRLPELRLLKLPMILADDKKKIASTRIRRGEIDRWGRLYECQMSNVKCQIDEKIRQELKKPLGKLIRGDSNDLKKVEGELRKIIGTINPVLISTVGDEVTKVCNEVGLEINLAIVDFRVQREEKYHNLMELGFNLSLRAKRSNLYRSPRPDVTAGLAMTNVTLVNNPPGHITKELVSAVKNAYWGIIKDGKQKIIRVDGEEDLAGVPAILLAPLGSLLLYGQPHEGMVAVEVTEEKKQELFTLINRWI